MVGKSVKVLSYSNSSTPESPGDQNPHIAKPNKWLVLTVSINNVESKSITALVFVSEGELMLVVG